MIYVSWTGDDGEHPFDFVYSETRNAREQEGFQDGIWNAEYANVPDNQLPLTRELYESSEGFGQAISTCCQFTAAVTVNPDDWIHVTYKPTWEELEAEATRSMRRSP